MVVSQPSNSTTRAKIIDELATSIRRLDENLNRLIDLNNSYCGQLNNIQSLIMKHDHLMQIPQVDIAFNHGAGQSIHFADMSSDGRNHTYTN